jgi:regulator of protease activity HflC (stomatin/prohibitin superfamily)
MDDDTKVIAGISTFLVILVLLAFSWFLWPFKIIGAGERGVVLYFGAVSRTMNEGLNWRIPVAEGVVVLDVKTQKEQVNAAAASKDLQIVTATIALNFHLQPDKVGSLYQSIGADYKSRIIDPAIQEAIKATTSKYTAEELITKRQEVKDETKTALRDRLSKEFIIVDELSIVNFDFSKSFNEAIESKVTAEQNALASKNKLEQVKYEAEQRIAEAKGEAEAIKIQAQAIQQQGGAEYVKLQAINKWNGQMPSIVPSNAVPFIDFSK